MFFIDMTCSQSIYYIVGQFVTHRQLFYMQHNINSIYQLDRDGLENAQDITHVLCSGRNHRVSRLHARSHVLSFHQCPSHYWCHCGPARACKARPCHFRHSLTTGQKYSERIQKAFRFQSEESTKESRITRGPK